MFISHKGQYNQCTYETVFNLGFSTQIKRLNSTSLLKFPNPKIQGIDILSQCILQQLDQISENTENELIIHIYTEAAVMHELSVAEILKSKTTLIISIHLMLHPSIK